VDVRIVAATNKDLARLVEEGQFREDLYYRLNVFPVDAPPLRTRKEDIPALVKHFVTRINAEENKRVLGAAPQTLALLQSYDWPGNVRQLENTIFRAVVLCDGDFLLPEDFPHVQNALPDFEAPLDLPEAANAPANLLIPLAANTDLLAAAGEAGNGVAIFDPAGHLRTLEQIERDLIEYAIDLYAGHMTEVARRLGIGRSTLYRKLKEYDLEEHVARAAS
jgi:DNA-binding NtrC family response regulator